MVESKTTGIILFTKISSENNLYLKILTDNDEIITGICFAGATKKKKNILQTMTIKEPLKIDYENDSTDEIINKIAHSIEQHESFLKVIPKEDLKKEKELNKKREF